VANRKWFPNEKIEVFFGSTHEIKKKYRYLLKCTWQEELERVTFVMLNPSVADSKICDPTLNRCVNFSKNWGYGGMNIVNLYAFIATDPKELFKCEEPVGIDNDKYIIQSVGESEKVIFAWGEQHQELLNRANSVIKLLKDYKYYCIKKTKNGVHPRHPLYLKSDLKPIVF
jgi:hypothetical protein